MSSIPAEVQRQIDEILKAIREHPEHEFGALRRRELYRAFGDNPVGKRARGWIGVIAARKVLPIYEATVPPEMSSYDVPQSELEIMAEAGEPYLEEWKIPIKGKARRMLELAEGILSETVAPEYATNVTNNHYHSSLQIFDFFETDGGELPAPTFVAVYAAYQALVEACGTEALKYLEAFHRTRDGAHHIFGGIEGDDSQWVNATQLKDFEMAGNQPSDAAANAMAAYVLNLDAKRQLVTKLEFWEWWLTEAMAHAWEKAAQTPPE